jgi:hypothetical protein
MELMWLSGTRYSFSQDELIPAAIGDSFNSYIEVGILETPDGRGDVIASIRGHSYGYVNGVRVPLPLSSSSLFAAGGDDLWVLDVDGLTLSRFGPNDAVRRWSLEGIARPNVDDASRKRALQLTYRERSDDTAVQALPVPERMPAFDRMIIDDVGDVWLRRFSLDRNREGSKWYVVGAGSGDVPCAVEFPVGFEVAGFDRGNRIALRSGVDGSPTIEWAARN